MSRELIWDPLVTDDTFFQNAFQFFTERGWIRIDPDGVLEIVNVTATQCFRGVIFDLLALYHAVLVASETVQDKTITHKEFMKHMARIPVDQLPGQELPPGPLLSSVTVDNALTRFSEMGIFDYVQVRKVLEGVADPDQIDQVKRFLGRLLGL
jgi:hypothetical protein